ncbi:MAG: hypothetical protein IPJ94_19565 [Chloroflexi bacterium]|nr:hypothetical protein [Chloroflexota bacterium]
MRTWRPADKYAAAAGKLPPPPGDTPPAELTKKAMVDHLSKMRGIAKWKLTVATKEQVAALFDLPEAEALAAIDAFGAAHTAKYSQKGADKQPEPTAVTKLPPPPEDPATLSKKRWSSIWRKPGIAKWKLNVATKEQVVALFDMPEADALAAIDAFGAAHTAKYAGSSKEKVAPPPAVPPGAAAFNKYQQDASSLSADEAQLALAYARQEGYSKVVLFQLKQQYQAQIGDPLVTGMAATGTKSYLVAQLQQATGLPIYLLNKLKKDELVALIDQPMSAAFTAVGKSYTPTAAAPPPASRPTAQAPAPPPKAPEPPPPADPVDLLHWDPASLSDFCINLGGVFTPGSPAYKGAEKAAGNLQYGQSGFGYHDADGQPSGIVTFDKVDPRRSRGDRRGVSGHGRQQDALADVANVALSKGLKLKTYVPKALMGTYKTWGFQMDSSIGNGAYMVLSPADMPGFVAAVGKKPKSAPKPAQKQAQAIVDADDEMTVMGTPGGVSAAIGRQVEQRRPGRPPGQPVPPSRPASCRSTPKPCWSSSWRWTPSMPCP